MESLGLYCMLALILASNVALVVQARPLQQSEAPTPALAPENGIDDQNGAKANMEYLGDMKNLPPPNPEIPLTPQTPDNLPFPPPQIPGLLPFAPPQTPGNLPFPPPQIPGLLPFAPPQTPGNLPFPFPPSLPRPQIPFTPQIPGNIPFIPPPFPFSGIPFTPPLEIPNYFPPLPQFPFPFPSIPNNFPPFPPFNIPYNPFFTPPPP